MKSKLFFDMGLKLMSLSITFATPTSVFWTDCTTGVQDAGTYHIEIDNCFSISNRTKNGSSFPPDIGLTAGLFSWEGIGAEVGIDYIGGESDPFYFNGKIALVEGRLFKKSPSFSIGVFGLGTTRDTNIAVVNAIFGTTLPENLGRLFAGVYTGKRAIGKHRSGWLVGYQKSLYKALDTSGKDYSKWEFNADFVSNKNVIGGGSLALTYHFTPKISLESGPVWFNDTSLNGRWKWSVQLGIDI